MSVTTQWKMMRPVILTIMVAGILLVVPASIGMTGSDGRAYAQGYGSDNGGQGKGNGNGQNGNNNSTTSHGNSGDGNNNSTNGNHDASSNGQGKGPGDDVSGHGHSAYERMQDYVNETAEQRHQEHVSMNAPITGPFTANLNYTVSANGNATAISDNSTVKNATLTLYLSIWKSTKSVVSLDIINGTVKIGDNQTRIYSGHAYYLANKPRLLVYAFIVDNGAGSSGNSSGSSGPSVKLLKLFMSGDGTLPANSSDPALKVTALSPQSKIASEWFLDMDGQVQRS